MNNSAELDPPDPDAADFDAADFDAAGLVDAILGVDRAGPNATTTAVVAPPPPQLRSPTARVNDGHNMGWLLAWLLAIALLIAVGLATRSTPDSVSPQPPVCGGLFDTECCVEWDPPHKDRPGLFDAEDDFVVRSPRERC